jgi:hypothetical protein
MALTDNLVSYWKLDEASGNAADSVDGNTGVNTSVTYAAGKINNGAVFNGTSSVLNCGFGSNLNVTTAFTIFAWIKPASGMLSGTYKGIIRRGYWDYSIDISNGKFLVAVNNAVYLADTIALSADTWYLVTWVHDASGDYIYVNGSLSTSGNLPDVTTNSDLLRIGGSTGSDGTGWYGTDGMIDEARIWSRALTSTEVTYLYNGGAGLAYPFTTNTGNFFAFF